MDRLFKSICVLVMMFVAVCFAGITAIVASAVVSNWQNSKSIWTEVGVTILLLFLTIISSVIAYRIWKPDRDAPSTIPIWVIQSMGVVLLISTVAITIAGRRSVFMFSASTVIGGMLFAGSYLKRKEADK